MNLFKFLAPRAKKITNCSTINYTCEDEQLDTYIKEYGSGIIDAKQCIRNILEYIERFDALHIKENCMLFPLLEDMMRDSEWKTEWTYDCGDYDPSKPERRLSAVHEAYKLAYDRISYTEEILVKSHRPADANAIVEKLNRPYITADMVINRNILKEKEEETKAIVQSGNYTPYEALLLIKENWRVMYPNVDAYSAIDYCLICSKNVTIPAYFDSELRNIGLTLGNTFKNLKENKN